MGDKGYFSRFVSTDSSWRQLFVSGDKNVLFFLVQGEHFSHMKLYVLLLGRKGEVRDPFLHLLFLKCMQRNIIHIAGWHIWGWHVLIPFRV